MFMKTRRIFGLAASALFLHTTLNAQVPQIINYQGRIVSGTTNFSGTGQFKFALVNAAGSVTFWSNNGSSAGGSEPSAAVSLAVSNGLYSVLLGDTNIANMTAGILPASFTNIDVRLRVWFNGGSGSQLLTPDQRIAAVGYSMISATVPDGVITSNKLADGAVTTIKLADGAITAGKLASNSVTSLQLSNNIALGDSNSLSGRLDVYRTTAGTPAISLFGNSSQISTYGSDGQEQVRIYGVSYGDLWLMNSLSNNAIAARLSANASFGGYLDLRNSNGLTRAFLSGTNSGGFLQLRQADGAIGAILSGDSSGAGRLDLNNASGLSVAQIFANAYGGQSALFGLNGLKMAEMGSSYTGGGFAQFYNTNGTITAQIDGDSDKAGYITVRGTNGSVRVGIDGAGSNNGGQVSLFNSSGDLGADLFGDIGGAGEIRLYSTNETLRLLLDGRGTGSGGEIIAYTADGGIGARIYGDSGGAGYLSLYNTNGLTRVGLDGLGNSGGGQITVLANDGSTTLSLQGDNGGAGYLAVNNGVSAARVVLDGEGNLSGGEIGVYGANGAKTIEIQGTSDAANAGGQIYFYQADGTASLQIDGEVGSGGGGYMDIRNSNGTVTVKFEGQDSSGKGRVTTQVLEITGGSDLSEQFDINAAPGALQPGLLVSIDTQRPGELVLSAQPYDRTVAGVVSGAGGVTPGMLMGQAGSKANGKHPVALTGRVYCWADASTGAIRPGDLLTTSATPGHAMRVTDYTRAQGAIIGKAMTSLSGGKGLVLVLVTLQ